MSGQPPESPDPEAARHAEVVDLLKQIRDRLPQRETTTDWSAPVADVDGR